tara:strand:+ start:11211 stop:11567 length:357 start_codon:yes stop_codon:yes gene_type:complete
MSEVQGKLIVKDETKVYGSNGFKKREFVIETDDKYPQTIQLELVQDKCELLDTIKLGEVIKVSYNLNGRSWTNPQGETKYFNSVQGWKIEKVQGVNTTPTSQYEPAMPLGEQDEDVPF